MIGQLAAILVSDWSRKFGYSWWGEDAADSAAVAGDFFRRIDENGDGAVAFEEWLTFALGHYRDKSSELPRAFDSLDRWALVLDIYISTNLVQIKNNTFGQPRHILLLSGKIGEN